MREQLKKSKAAVLLLSWRGHSAGSEQFCLLPLPELKPQDWETLDVTCLNRKPSELGTEWRGFGERAIFCDPEGLLDVIKALFKRLSRKAKA